MLNIIVINEFIDQEDEKRINEADLRRAFADNLARANDILDSDKLNMRDITATEEGVDKIIKVVSSLHDLVKRQQEEYCNLGVRFACLQSHIGNQRKQMYAAQGRNNSSMLLSILLAFLIPGLNS